MPIQRGHRQRRERTFEEKRLPLQCFTNAWYDSFFTHHDLTGKDDVPAVEAKKRIGSVEDTLTSFLQTSEGQCSPRGADLVKKLCKSFRLRDIEAGLGKAGTRKGSWIDDRNSDDLTGRGNSRPCEDWLTATGLLRYLEQPRYNHKKYTNAERRLLYIADLTPEYILALAVTAPFNQVPILRDTICKHVAFQPSIRVKVPSNGMPTFQMEIHLPFFALRKIPHGHDSKALRKWENVSLLTGESKGPEDPENYRIYPAQISCTVYGYDEWQWTACVFADTEYNSGEPYDFHSEDGAKDGVDGIGETIPDLQIKEDPITTGLDEPVDANTPILRPRQYFAKAFETSVQEVWQEWDQLIHKLDVDIIEYKRAHPFTYINASQNPRERAEEMKRSFDWTLQRMELLSKLTSVLSGPIDEWNTFISPYGDVDYFSDLDEFPSNSPEFRHPGHAGRSLRNIKETFERLQDLHQKLESLTASLNRDFIALNLRLSLEGNDAAEHSVFNSMFSIWVLYPITVATQIFSMQPAMIPFGLKPMWLGITLIILIIAMLVMHWLMKKWTLWQKEITVWMKVKQLEEEGRCGLDREYQNDVIPGADVYRPRDRGDEESLGTRALLARRFGVSYVI